MELLSRVDLSTEVAEEANNKLHRRSQYVLQVVSMWAEPEMLPELQDRLKSIFSSAMVFSQLLRRQRACWTIQGPTQSEPVPTHPVKSAAPGISSRKNEKKGTEIKEQYGGNESQPPPLPPAQEQQSAMEQPPPVPSREPFPTVGRVVFDPITMKDDGDDDDGDEDDGDKDDGSQQPRVKFVELFVSPGLFKRGDADGENFETQTCIVSRLVLCRND